MAHSVPGLTFAGLSDIGLRRSSNQDSYYISPAGDLFIVADGMGGHVGGQEASAIATNTIQQYLTTHRDSDCPTSDLLKQAIDAANEAVLADQRQHPERFDMGTTVVVVLLRDEQVWCAHVGDSRLYLLRESGFFQITQDHTWVAQAARNGDLTSDQMQTHPWRNMLSQCVGREDMLAAEPQQIETEPGDRLLLCSDGLTEELTDGVMVTYLQAAPTCELAVSKLIEAAKAQGGRDNITAIALFLSQSHLSQSQ
ncbi:MAG: Stp1/IreP family PP2C-type Ser/Thr phosphatase [Phormidesmis sp.]